MPRSLLHLAMLVSLLAGPLGGCDDGSGERQIARLKAERARADPPALWSIAVVGEADPGRPVQICANRRVVSGFTSIQPAAGGQDCKPIEAMIPTESGVRFRCKLDGVLYAVSSATRGDPERDFQVSSSAYPISDPGPEYARTLRFTRLAKTCPAGWTLGEATDQQGVRTQAFAPDAD